MFKEYLLCARQELLSVIGMGKVHFLPSGDVGFSAHFKYWTFFTFL